METEGKNLLNWHNIDVSKDYKNKGIAFEHLIEQLLISQFDSGYWVRTQDTNDGKKDFVHPDEINALEWLECKNYENPISINIISPTLILGAVHDINTFYIYSRSQLNRNALEDICHYQKLKNIKIKVFDGAVLESCIYNSRNNEKLIRFFPETNFDELDTEITKLTTIFYYSIRDVKNNKLTNDLQFELGEFFQLNIVAQNQSLITTHSEFVIKVFDSNKKIYFSQHKIIDKTNFGDLTLHTIKCQTLHSGKTTLKIEIFDKDNKLINTFKREIFVSEEPHCFMLLEWIAKKEKVLSLISRKNKSPVILSGASGTGKSTIIQQLCIDLIKERKYLVLQIDLKCQTVQIKEDLLNQIVGNDNIDDIENMDDNLSALVYGEFQSDDDFVKVLKKVLPNDKEIVFTIDNAYGITNYHHTILLNKIKKTLEDSNVSAYFLFELNTDEMEYDKFITAMDWASFLLNITCQKVDINKFNRKDILNFFLLKYGIDIKKYLRFKSIEISALEVSRLALALKTKGIIQKLYGNKNYVIIDEIEMNKYLQKYFFSKDNLSFILRKQDFLISGDFIFKFIYLNGRINTNAEVPANDFKQLLELQIIKRSGNNYVFAHDKLRNLIVKNLHFNDDDYVAIYQNNESTLYAKCICAIERINNLLQAKEFLYNFFLKPPRITKTEEIFNICECIINNIDILYNSHLGNMALKYVTDNYNMLNSSLGREEYGRFLTHATEIFLNSNWWHHDHDIAFNICYLLKKYLDRILSLHKNEDCILCANNCIKLISSDKVSGLEDKEKKYYLCYFHNRKAIAMSRLKDIYHDNDCYSYNASQECAKQAIMSEKLEYQMLVDDFHRHYSYYDDLSAELITNYIYELRKIEAKELKINYGGMKYHLALFEFLAIINNVKIANTIENVLSDINNTLQLDISPYYTIKLNILKLYILLYLKDFSTAKNDYTKAIEYAYDHEFRHYMYQLNFVYSYILKWEKSLTMQKQNYVDFAFLSLNQFLNINLDAIDLEKFPVEIKRDCKAIKQLLEIIQQVDSEYCKKLNKMQNEFINKIKEIDISNLQSKKSLLKIIINGVLFPNC